MSTAHAITSAINRRFALLQIVMVNKPDHEKAIAYRKVIDRVQRNYPAGIAEAVTRRALRELAKLKEAEEL